MSRDIIGGRYDFDYLATQRKVIDSVASMRYPNIMYCGGFGSGKTRLAGEIGWELGLAYPGIEVGYFRKTRVSIYDTTYKAFIDEVVPPEYIRPGGWKKGTLEVTLRNKSYYHFFGIDNFQRKGSLRFDVIIVDEAIELDEDDAVMLQGRLRGRVLPLPQIIYLCNPGAPGSFLWKWFVKNAELLPNLRDPDFAYFSTNSFENTYNPKAYFDRLKKWVGTQYYDRYVLGLWKAMKGVIWQEFDPKIHVIKPFEIPRNWPKRIAVDFGYDNPMVILWIAKDPGTGSEYVYRQYYHTGALIRKAVKTAKDISMKSGEQIDLIRADHDAEGRAQFEEDWMSTIAARKEVLSGIQAVEEAFMEMPNGNRGLYIFDDDWSERDGFWYGNMEPDPILRELNKPTCLQEEIPGYKWGKDDRPIKEDDHACDALRYHIFTEKCEEGGGSLAVYKQRSYSKR